MMKRINYSFFYCEICNKYHYTYWLDNGKENLFKEEVDKLLDTGRYYIERKFD